MSGRFLNREILGGGQPIVGPGTLGPTTAALSQNGSGTIPITGLATGETIASVNNGATISGASIVVPTGSAGSVTYSVVTSLGRTLSVVATVTAIASLPTVSAAPVMVLGLKKKIAAYNGPALRARRASDNAVQDISFAGSDVDSSALNTFKGSSTLWLVTLYDQSGNGFNRTQATVANQHQLVLFNGEWQIIANGLDTVPALGFNRNNMSLFSVSRVNGVASQSRYAVWSASPDTSPYDMRIISPTTAYTIQIQADGGTLVSTAPSYRAVPGVGKSVVSIVSSTSGIKTAVDAYAATSGTALSSLVNANPGAVGGVAVDYALVVYPASLSSADEEAVRSALATIYGAKQSPTYVINYQGDSIANGVGLTSYGSPPRLVADAMAATVRVFNSGVPSAQLAAGANPNDIVPGVTNVLFGEYGTNNLGAGGQTAATVFARMQTWAANARTNGYSKVIQRTILARSDGVWTDTMEAERLSLNNMIRAAAPGGGGTQVFDAVSDVAANTTISNNGSSLTDAARSSNSATYYQDKLHPTDAANAVMVAIDKAALVAVGVPGS